VYNNHNFVMVINKNKEEGFSLVELLVVITIMGVIIALAGGLSYKSAYRRSVDSLTTRVANTLQLTKLRAARNGVEFKTSFVESDNELQLITEMGDSNIDSTIWTSDQNSVTSLNIDSSVDISTIPSLFIFKPNGTAAPDDGVFNLNVDDNFTVLAASKTGVDRCGKVIVSGLGRIAVIQGHWDGTNCKQVADK